MSTAITFPDISEWYTPERIAAEEPSWRAGGERNAYKISALQGQFPIQTIVECGCGTGWVPYFLSPTHPYIGLDKNAHMLGYARVRNPSLSFIQGDIHNAAHLSVSADLVCSFSVLKHFSLTDWPVCLRNILSVGRYALFTQHILPNDREPMDIGTEWHESWPTRSMVEQVIADAGHEIIAEDASHMNEAVGAPEVYLTTRRKS
jgi:SAM-dependent methyltransferase